jgi:hypothetical protein
MRILTVRQPWALHIIQSGKDVENRIHNLAGDYRGPVAIHAALKPDQQALRDLPRKAPNGIPRVFEYGAIVGVVDLVDVHHADAEDDQCSEWAQPAVHHLKLANPRKLARHIPYRGALGLRTLDPDVVSQIERGGYITHESRGATS